MASRWHQFAETLAEDCLFTLGDNTVNLCPIARTPQRITEYRDPAHSHSEGTKLVLAVGREETDLQYSPGKVRTGYDGVGHVIFKFDTVLSRDMDMHERQVLTVMSWPSIN
jgi:hypothetical protein